MLAEVIYDGELSGVAYAILFVVLLMIVGGLGWCFYRALKAGDRVSEPQPSEDGEGSA